MERDMNPSDRPDSLRFQTPYGGFAPDNDAFRITRSDTPAPWTNILSNGRYGTIVSQRGGGVSWLDNAQLNVLTRWDMDLVRDPYGKFLYVADLDSGEIWSLAPAPCGDDYDGYSCEHRPGRTTFTTSRSGIEAVWTMGVAETDDRDPDTHADVWHVTLTNRSGKTRRLRIASFMEWCLGAAPDVKREFHTLFIETRHDEARRAVFATKNMWDIPDRTEKDHWNRPWPYVAAHAMQGTVESAFTTGDKAAFLGRFADPARPFAMTGDHPQAKFGRSGDSSASVGGDLTLDAKEMLTLSFTLAVGSDQASVEHKLDALNTPEAAASAIAESMDTWAKRLAPTRVSPSAPEFDTLNTTWLPYQAIAGRLWGRTGYYQQSGAFGFRDQLQDSNVWLPRDPDRCREQILLHASHQFADGSVYHWWHPLAEFGLRTACSDDYLWLPFLLARYIKETGRRDLLHERAPFVDDETGATVIDHAQRSIERAFGRLSERGLPLIGSCDWNDGLSACGIEGKGESIWLACFIVGILRDWSEILETEGDAAGAALCRERVNALQEAVEAHAWDGAWYRRATTDAGVWLGSSEREAGKIFLNPQTWSILNDAAPEERQRVAWDSVKEHLLRDMGPLLLAPAYDTPDEDVGYITRYAPGGRENGGVYMHAAVWALAAACKRRDAEAIDRIWSSIAPPVRGMDADGYVAEPYVTPGNVDGPTSGTPGRAGWTWYTGSAAWLHTVSLEWMLGLRPEFGGLRIDPAPASHLGKVEAERLWRGRAIRLSFDAGGFAPGSRAVVELNGRPLSDNILTETDAPEGATVDLRVTWETGLSAEAEVKNGSATIAPHTKPSVLAEGSAS